MKSIISIVFITILLTVIACASGEPAETEKPGQAETKDTLKTGGEMTFELTSSGFNRGDTIPDKYTCTGEDISPALSWNDPPDSTVEFALICDDPDVPVGVWSHWIVYSIPVDVRGIPEGEKNIPGIEGKNDFGRTNYGGPCPPPGKPHRYFFTLYALDTKVDLKVGATRKEILAAIDGHIIAKAELMGFYGR